MAKVVSVHSFRGGTGKSNLTANLATMVARVGNRVGIVDTDIQSPGIHVLFGLDDQKMGRTLNDYLRGRCAVEDAAIEVSHVFRDNQVSVAPGSALYLIPSSIKTGEIAQVLREGYDVELLNSGFRDLIKKLNLDYLFLDTHPGLNEETLLSIAISDVLVLILRPDRQDFQGTAVTVDVARKLEVPKMLLVVNKALVSFDFDVIKRQVEATYNATVAQVLPLTEDMLQLASSDVFSLRYPDHPYTKGVQSIADQLLQ